GAGSPDPLGAGGGPPGPGEAAVLTPDAGRSHRAGGEGGGGIFGSRRVMVAAAIIAVLFVAIGTTAGVVLTGRDSGSGGQAVAAAGAFPTTDPIPPSSTPTAEPPAAANLVRVAGSSEVAPITETAYNEFRQSQRNVTVSIEATSTEDGFAALCSGKAELADASFELTPQTTKDPACAKKVVGFEVAHHTLPIVVNPQNTWLHCLNLKQVKQIWGADSSVTRWDQIDSSFPDEPIAFVGPPHDSVQAEVFNATISDASDRSRAYKQVDLSGVANDVAGDRSAIGFLDYPTYETFGTRLRGVEINNGEGCVAPTAVAVGTGLYLPLCKPLFVYARTDALRQPATAAFLRYFLENGRKIAFDAHYVPRSDDTVGDNVARLEKLTAGVATVPA
ncbi:substrate-binding domain-containing protein, partial [Frankia sp. AiPs1]|uniref:substrate-binding domain-containing protein n=1 Tax=Frankia sp. AiPs1 TaxID=573493 RepID=UPI0020437A4F